MQGLPISWLHAGFPLKVSPGSFVECFLGDYSDSEMYTTDMLDEEGKPVLARATMSTEQANQLRKSGMAGGQDTPSGAGRQDV
jgi:hypothetical protein